MKFPASILFETVKGLDGKDVLDETKSPLTVKAAIRFALTSISPSNEQPDGEKKFLEYNLAARLHNQDEPTGTIDISSEERTMIKAKSKYLSTEVMGYLYKILEKDIDDSTNK